MNKTFIYIFSEDQKMVNWATAFSKDLALISTQFIGNKETFEVTPFTGELSEASKHIFIITEDSKLAALNISNNAKDIFQVHLSPIANNNIPSFLKDAPVFEFYQTDNLTDEINWIQFDGESSGWEKLLDVSKRIFNIYKKDKATIYLAKTSLSQIANRDKLKRDLLNQGYNVIPETSLDDSNTDVLEKKITDLLNTAQLSIHILGNDIVEESNQKNEIVEFQNKVAAKSNNDKLHRLIWLSADIHLDKNNEETISVLKKDLELLKDAEFVETPLEMFKSLVYQKLDNISHSKNNVNDGIYFIYEVNENAEIKSILKEIEKNKLKVLTVNSSDKNPLLNHKNNLNISNGIIVYYDGSNNNWIENILNDIIKAPKYRTNKKLNAIGIVSKNDIQLKPELESYQLEIIDISNQNQLETFIKNINK